MKSQDRKCHFLSESGVGYENAMGVGVGVGLHAGAFSCDMMTRIMSALRSWEAVLQMARASQLTLVLSRGRVGTGAANIFTWV